MAKESKAFLVGRNSNTGRFVAVDVARNRPNIHVVERMPKTGYGDTPKTARKDR